jgi:hypothetical protein
MTLVGFFAGIKTFANSVHAFARSRQLPTEEEITHFRTEAAVLPDPCRPVVSAMADSLASLRQKMIDAGKSASMADMWQWAVDALAHVISIIPEDRPEMKAARSKLVLLQNKLTDKKDQLNAVGEPLLLQLASLLSAMAGGAANTQGQ